MFYRIVRLIVLRLVTTDCWCPGSAGFWIRLFRLRLPPQGERRLVSGPPREHVFGLLRGPGFVSSVTRLPRNVLKRNFQCDSCVRLFLTRGGATHVKLAI